MTPANPDALADALAEFQRRNGFHKHEIEELLMDFGALVLAAAEARAAQLQAEVEALKEDRADAERTVEQWFDTKAKSVEQIRPKLAEALGGYLRVCRCGGMSAEESELVEATLGDFLRRQSGSIVAPVVETMVAERLAARTALAARAATAREGQTHTPASNALKIEEADRDA